MQDLHKCLFETSRSPANEGFLFFCSRCTCVAWVPEGDGSFVVAHADGNIYVYEKVGLGGASTFYYCLATTA